MLVSACENIGGRAAVSRLTVETFMHTSSSFTTRWNVPQLEEIPPPSEEEVMTQEGAKAPTADGPSLTCFSYFLARRREGELRFFHPLGEEIGPAKQNSRVARWLMSGEEARLSVDLGFFFFFFSPPLQMRFVFLSSECYVTATEQDEAAAGKAISGNQTRNIRANNTLRGRHMSV